MFSSFSHDFPMISLTSRRVLVLGGFNSSNTAGALVGTRRFEGQDGTKHMGNSGEIHGKLWEIMGHYGKLWEIMGNYGKLWEND